MPTTCAQRSGRCSHTSGSSPKGRARSSGRRCCERAGSKAASRCCRRSIPRRGSTCQCSASIVDSRRSTTACSSARRRRRASTGASASRRRSASRTGSTAMSSARAMHEYGLIRRVIHQLQKSFNLLRSRLVLIAHTNAIELHALRLDHRALLVEIEVRQRRVLRWFGQHQIGNLDIHDLRFPRRERPMPNQTVPLGDRLWLAGNLRPERAGHQQRAMFPGAQRHAGFSGLILKRQGGGLSFGMPGIGGAGGIGGGPRGGGR